MPFHLTEWQRPQERPPPKDEMYTEATIEGARRRLSRPVNQSPLARISSLLREESSKSPGKSRQRKIFGKSPWHRKNSMGSDVSASSSIRDIIMGETPLATPSAERPSSADWSNQYPGGVSAPMSACTPALSCSEGNRLTWRTGSEKSPHTTSPRDCS